MTTQERMNITVSLANFDRRRLYGKQTNSNSIQGVTFWLSENASQLLVDLFKSLKENDKIIVGYELVKVQDYHYKVVRSIIKDLSPKITDYFQSTSAVQTHKSSESPSSSSSNTSISLLELSLADFHLKDD